MKRTPGFFLVSLVLALVFVSASRTLAEIDVGDYTISGSAEAVRSTEEDGPILTESAP